MNLFIWLTIVAFNSVYCERMGTRKRDLELAEPQKQVEKTAENISWNSSASWLPYSSSAESIPSPSWTSWAERTLWATWSSVQNETFIGTNTTITITFIVASLVVLSLIIVGIFLYNYVKSYGRLSARYSIQAATAFYPLNSTVQQSSRNPSIQSDVTVISIGSPDYSNPLTNESPLDGPPPPYGLKDCRESVRNPPDFSPEQ